MLLANYVSAANASIAMSLIRHRTAPEKHLHIAEQLVRTGPSGSPLGQWLIFIVEQDDYPRISLLVGNRVCLKNDDSQAQRLAMIAKDFPKPEPLLEGRPLPTTLSGLSAPSLNEYENRKIGSYLLVAYCGYCRQRSDNALVNTELTRLIDLTLIDVLV